MNISSSTSSSTDYSRITGLATGMDTDAMVKQAVAGDQAKIDSALQSKQILEWQQEAYVDIIKDLKTFQSSYLDILGSNDTSMMKSSTYAGVSATSDEPTKINATVSGGAVKGNYLVEVTQKALTAKGQSSVFSGATQSSTLSSLGLTNNKAINITVNEEAFTFTVDNTKTVSDLVTSLKAVTNSNGETLGNLANISFSELTGKFTIETKDTGSGQELAISGEAATELGMATGEGNIGTDAIVSITAPGEAEATVTKSSNKFTIDNITYDLSNSTNGDTATLTVKADTTEQVAKFKKFIEAYNTLIEKINDKVSEKKNLDYKPLTDSQKEEMTDDEIEKWETQAKKGVLRRESNLSNLLVQLRQSFYSTVEGAGISLTDIGISTTSDYLSGGKLEIDEDKLETALEEKGDLVQKLFTQSGDTSSSKGILQKMKDSFENLVGNNGLLIQKSGYTNTRWTISNELTKSIEAKKAILENLEDRYYEKQTRYYQMFAALEKNINNLNSQSNWLYSQLGTA